MKLFVSYRRSDTQDFSGRLADRLRQTPGVEQVFIDVDGIAPGERFPDKLESSLKQTDANLVVIGQAWAGPREGQPARIHDAEDFVRAEVRGALKSGKRVIPVLANGAVMPGAESLPEDIHTLPTLNAVSVRHSDFERDVDYLADLALGRKKPSRFQSHLQRHPVQAALFRVVTGLLLGAALLLTAAAVHGAVLNQPLELTLGGRGPVLLAIAGVLGLSVLWRLQAGARKLRRV